MAPAQNIDVGNLETKEESVTHGSSYSMPPSEYYDEPAPRRFHRFVDSFKRDNNLSFFPSDHLSQVNSHASQGRYGTHYYDLRLATLESANTGLARKLKGRHLQMIAIGGSIGTQASASSPLRPSMETKGARSPLRPC